jgi:hypothetical protein
VRITDTPDDRPQESLEAGSPLEQARGTARAAARAIHARRADLRPRDRGIDYFPDHTDLDAQLAAVVAYVNRYRDVPRHVLHADAVDQAAILAYVRVNEERLRLGVINALRALGLTWPQVAAALGLASAQAAQQQWLRLTSAVAGGPRSERAARAARREAAGLRAAAETHEQKLRRLAGELAGLVRTRPCPLPAAALEDSDVDVPMWADEVVGLAGGPLTSLALSELRWFAGELLQRDDVDEQVTAIAKECVALLA